jgi:hypothetical protein
MEAAARPVVVRVSRPPIPFVPHYCVVSLATPSCGRSDIRALCDAAHGLARREAEQRFGDSEAYTLLFNAGRTRRRPHPHVHVVLAPTVGYKRRALFWLALKHVTRRVSRWCAPFRPLVLVGPWLRGAR